VALNIAIEDLNLPDFIRAGDHVVWGQASAEPLTLTQRLWEQSSRIGPLKIFLGISYGSTLERAWCDQTRFSSYCGTGQNRRLSVAGRLDILPCHYSVLPARLGDTVDVLLLQLAPANAEGRYSLGLACEYLLPLIDRARVVIAEVSERVPFTFGEREIQEDEIDVVVKTSSAPLEITQPAPGAAELAIARHIDNLIEDGATLQLGLGALPEAILSHLSARNLGIHSGLIGDKVAELMNSGVITNTRKTIDPGMSVAGIMVGTRKLYDFADGNKSISLRSTDYTHSLSNLARIDRFVALNSAIEVDLTGQVNAEVANGVYVGAVGGAVDFLRGAHHSRGGMPIVALPSSIKTSQGPRSRIVNILNGPVSTSRADAGIIVTDHGVADLRHLTVSERQRAMIAIAAPEFREELERNSRGSAT
jgi:acetyl-CoA hydrolase